MKLVTFNVNGIRAAERRGFRAWLEATAADFLALQEVRCPLAQLPPSVFEGYHCVYDPGQLAGRNGVALLSRVAPKAQRIGLIEDREFAHEGRLIEADYDLVETRLTIASLYLPKGAVPEDSPEAKAKYERKLRFCAALTTHLRSRLAAAAQAGRLAAEGSRPLSSNAYKVPMVQALVEDCLTGCLL